MCIKLCIDVPSAIQQKLGLGQHLEIAHRVDGMNNSYDPINIATAFFFF